MKRVAALALPFVFTLLSAAQTPAANPQPAPQPGLIAAHPDWPKANPEDVKSPEAIITALSNGISGKAGEPRDWTRVQSLFVPGVGRMAITRAPKDGPVDLTVRTFDEFKAGSGNTTFYEKPIAYQKQTFGHITHVYESYAIYREPAGTTAPTSRGVNSWELFFDGKRYWILQIYWDTERPDNPIPADLLK